MMRSVLAAALATAFLSVTMVTPSTAEQKKLTPQQQKMKDCSAKWKTEKETKKVSGRTEHRKFMSGCMKAKAA